MRIPAAGEDGEEFILQIRHHPVESEARARVILEGAAAPGPGLRAFGDERGECAGEPITDRPAASSG